MILTAIIMITVLAACGSSNTASSNNGDSEFDQDREFGSLLAQAQPAETLIKSLMLPVETSKKFWVPT